VAEDEEKTEDPTPKRREEAREEGNVPQSQDLVMSLGLLFSFVLIYFLMFGAIKELMAFINKFLTDYMINKPVTIRSAHTLFMEVTFFIADLVIPIMIGMIIIGVLSYYLQFGFLFTLQPLQPDLSSLNPIQGLKQLASKRSLVEFIKSVFKLIIVAGISFITLKGILPQLFVMGLSEARNAIKLLGNTIFLLAMRVSAVFIVLGIIDFFYQKWEHEQDLKMSKKEVEEERKQREGDPELKSKREEKQQEMAQQRMMQEVPEADVVITNPTHIAVALQFEMETMEAPLVVAKGEDLIAQKIKEIARENDVEIVEEKQLAQALNKMVEIGEEIPEQLYQAVAEILAYVYELEE